MLYTSIPKVLWDQQHIPMAIKKSVFVITAPIKNLLPKGSYGLYAYPYAENWVIYVHSKTGGLSFTEPDPSGILMKVNVPVQSFEEPLEQFTIDFVDSSLRMRWDTTKVVIPIH